MRHHLICAIGLAGGLIAGTALPTIAADAKGDFAVRGAGRLSCAELTDALAKKDATRLTIFGAWLEGYITANSQLLPNTFDATPWQTTELLLALSGQSCANRGPETQIMDVVGRLIAEMQPIRLAERSGLLRMSHGDAVQVHYRAVIERARDRLKALGYEFTSDEMTGKKALDELTANLKRYQTENKLQPSGRLDQHTLLNLFVRPQK